MSTLQPITSILFSQTIHNRVYNIDDYNALRLATIIASSISLFSAFVVICCFFYLRSANPEKTNRVSLRCVFIACCMHMITVAFDIAIVNEYGDTSFCRGANIIIMFTGVMCSIFLATVGVNLMLVFVIGIKVKQGKLEWIYYPCGVLYSFVTIIVPFYEMQQEPRDHETDYLCYYYINYYQVNGTSSSSWMTWYGFVFFTVVIAVFCSIAATIKLLREHHKLIGKFNNVITEDTEVTQTQVQLRREYHANVFLKVVARCILYTLVPFVCNICGFIIQLILINPHDTTPPGFRLALADTIMSCLQGVFMGAIFLTDPVMTQFISSKYKAWKRNYLDHFCIIQKYMDGHVEILYPPPPGLKVVPSTPIKKDDHNHRHHHQQEDSSIKTNNPIVTPSTTVHASYSSNLDDSATISYFRDIKTAAAVNHQQQFTVLPMRRLTISPSIYSRLVSSLGGPGVVEISEEEITSHPAEVYIYGDNPNYLIDPELNNTILLPYKKPLLAKTIHWFLVHLGFKRDKTYTLTHVSMELDNLVLDKVNSSPTHSMQQQLT